jgi:enediyne biosynthesis protein E4
MTTRSRLVAHSGWRLVALLALTIPACQQADPSAAVLAGHESAAPSNPTPGVPWFVDATAEAKLDFTHFDPTTPTYYIPETVGSGLAWIDYDGDGWLDLFCVQDCPVRPEDRTGSLPTHKLFRNNRDGTFTDVTAAVGLNVSGYGQGCAVGDYDNDGYDDLFVTYLDHVELYHNVPDMAAPGARRFVNVTSTSGIRNPNWGTSCAWGDLDGDGRLDLYICNYSKIDLANYVPCENPNVRKRDICPPNVFPTVSHKLYRTMETVHSPT